MKSIRWIDFGDERPQRERRAEPGGPDVRLNRTGCCTSRFSA
jgi:hypothetical protein